MATHQSMYTVTFHHICENYTSLWDPYASSLRPEAKAEWCCCAYVPAVPKAILEPRRAINSSSFPSSASRWISESVEVFCNNGREEQWATKVSMGEETMGKKGFLSRGDQCVAMSRYRAWTEAKLQSVMLFSISIILTALMSRDSRA